MKRILIIGCPGSGKSSCAKRLHKILHYPILHLDRIFHIDNKHQITRDELSVKITEFISKNETFIIDGNYTNTLTLRMQHADTILYFDIDRDTCIQNVINRTKSGIPREDIAPKFDNTILDPKFIEYIQSFPINNIPRIDKMLENYSGRIIKIKHYDELEAFYDSIL